MTMKNAKIILKNIVLLLPENLQQNAIDILSCRYLAQNTAQETAIILNIPIAQVIETLQAVKQACKGKKPIEFLTV